MKDKGDDGKRPIKGDSAVKDSTWRRQESRFSDFEDDSEFEESDRDSDFDAIYTEVEEDEPELELDADDRDAWSLDEEDDTDMIDKDDDDSSPWEDDEEDGDRDLWDMELDPEDSFDQNPPEETPEPIAAAVAAATFTATRDRTQEWEELSGEEDSEEDYGDEDHEEEDYDDDKERELNISMGMIVVAVFALILLAAGGYGIIEERASMQDEIRQLQASLATSAPPEEVAASRDALKRTSTHNTQLQLEVEELSRENRSLKAIISGLETQLTAQKAALERAPVAAAPAPVKKSAPVAAETRPAPEAGPAVSAPSGEWFVNFSSYSQRSTAETWSGKLSTEQGRVVVEAAESNGRPIYRVRVINLPDKATAEAVAERLQQKFNTGKLWVGRSG